MIARSFGGDAVCWVIFEHCIKELQSGGFERRDDFAGLLTTPFRERGLEIGKGGYPWPG